MEKEVSPCQLSIEICRTSTQAQDLMRWIFNGVVRFLEARRMRDQTDIGKGVFQSLEKEKEVDNGRIEECCLLHE